MSDLKQKGKNNVQARKVQINERLEVERNELDFDALEQVSGGGASLHDTRKVETTDINDNTTSSM